MKSWKLLGYALALAVMTTFVYGQVPQQVNYQCVLTDGSGAPLTGNFSVQFAIYDVATGGTALWTETQTVAVDNGFCSAQLGSVTPLPLNIYNSTPRFLGVAVESDPEMTPRQVFSSVAYAFSSQSAAEAAGDWNVNGNSTVNGFVGINYSTVLDESLIMAGTDSADAAVLKIGHDTFFNNKYSGQIIFEENLTQYDTTTADFCGIAAQYDGSTNDLSFQGKCGNTPDTIMVMDRSGRVAIGTGISLNILTVQQNALNDPIADAWEVYSSKRWKTDIETVDNPLQKVKQLRGVYYREKAKFRRDSGIGDDGQGIESGAYRQTERKMGLIAEEVGQVLPEVVSFEANGVDARSVDYSRLVAVLIEAVKTQQEQIEALQNTVSKLQVK